MSSSFEIPDSISFGDLEKLASGAPKEPTKKEGPYNGYTEQGLCEFVSDKLQEMQDAIPHPVVHKVAMMQILDHMLEWHIEASKIQIKNGELDSAGCWMRDAGKFQAIFNILATIGVGQDDFTMPEDKDDD